mgnify:CR=1 FL=1
MSQNYINWEVGKTEHLLNLSKKDLELIKILRTNSRASLTEIGKELRISKVAVYNRIKNLEKDNILLGYSAYINFSKLGLTTYQIGIKTSMTLTEKEAYIKQLSELPFINQILKLSGGKWDFLVRLISNNEMIVEQLNQISDVRIMDVDIIESQRVFLPHYPKGIIKNENISPIFTGVLDKKIINLLFALAKNSRESIINLSSSVKLSQKTIIKMMKNLNKEGILLNLFAEFNPFVYGNEAYILLITTKKRDKDEKIAAGLAKLDSPGVFLNLQTPNIMSYHLISSLLELKNIEKSLQPYAENIANYELVKLEEQNIYNLFPEPIYRYLLTKAKV